MKCFQVFAQSILIYIVAISTLQGQAVSITTDNSLPDASSILDVKSTNKGILVPRMTTMQRTSIPTPANGLLVYDTDTQSFWFKGSMGWKNLSGASGWLLSGNAAGTSDFIGTTNNQSLLFKANNVQAGKIDLVGQNTFWGVGPGTAITSGQFNTASGYQAFISNTTGMNNTATGTNALYFNTTGNDNAAFGLNALRGNTTGYSNTAVGNNALYASGTGINNTAIGAASLYSNSAGNDNTAIGTIALHGNSSGSENSAIGASSLQFNSTGISNSAVGAYSLNNNTTGSSNTAIGNSALYSNVAGHDGVAIGYHSQYYANNINTFWDNTNTSIGLFSLRGSTNAANNTGLNNTAIGRDALFSNRTGNDNTATGMAALFANTTGKFNTANGYNALRNNTSGNNNNAFGNNALLTNTTGSNNMAIGYLADVATNNLTNATAIGYNAKVAVNNSIVLGGTGSDAVKVGIGTQSPSATLEVNGQVKINGGSPGINKVLTSNANGLATWQSPAQREYAYIYNLASQFVAVESDIVFDTNGSLTPGFSHTPGSPNINVNLEGTYKVSFSVSGNEPNQFALFLNGALVAGSIYGSGSGVQQNNGQAIFSISAGDVITLRNHSSNAAVGLSNLAGGFQSNVNASILIEKM